MSRQGAGTSVPAPLAHPAACWAGLLGVPCWAGLLCAPVGGGPPASRPRHELRSARRLEARPGPAAAHGHRSQALRTLRRPPHQWACCAEDDSPRLEARPGPATSDQHRGQVRLSQRCLPRSCCCLQPHGCSGRRRPRPPARLGDLTSFGAAPRSPPVPSGPSGALHTCGAWLRRGWRPVGPARVVLR